MNLPDLLKERIEHAQPIKALFEKSIKPTSEEANRVRVILEELFWDMTIWFRQREFLGFYQVDRNTRVVHGLWPVNYHELCYLLFTVAPLMFDYTDVEQAMRWVRDIGAYHRLIDQGDWRTACDAVEKAIQSALATQNDP